eukprot:COSAG02_NODE_364_length_23758_cov_17.250011_6_plen_427_part_00
MLYVPPHLRGGDAGDRPAATEGPISGGAEHRFSVGTRVDENRVIRKSSDHKDDSEAPSPWGLGSDENNLAYDLVGFGTMDRVRGVRRLTRQQKISIPAELLRERPNALRDPGAVVLLIKLGCTLDHDTILEAIEALESELRLDTLLSRWSDVAGRKSVVRYERLLLKTALQNGNMLPGDPIGSLGSRTGGSPSRIQAEEDDYDSDPDDGPESCTIDVEGYSADEKLTTHLRFMVGDRVEAKISTPLGRTYYSPGCVAECFKLIEPDDNFPMPEAMIGRYSAYTINLDIGLRVFAPRDHDRSVRKLDRLPSAAELRFETMTHGTLSRVNDPATPPHTPWHAPLRFGVGRKVVANGQRGTITQHWYRDAHYPPNVWCAYQILLANGDLVCAPYDDDAFVRAQAAECAFLRRLCQQRQFAYDCYTSKIG